MLQVQSTMFGMHAHLSFYTSVTLVESITLSRRQRDYSYINTITEELSVNWNEQVLVIDTITQQTLSAAQGSGK